MQTRAAEVVAEAEFRDPRRRHHGGSILPKVSQRMDIKCKHLNSKYRHRMDIQYKHLNFKYRHRCIHAMCFRRSLRQHRGLSRPHSRLQEVKAAGSIAASASIAAAASASIVARAIVRGRQIRSPSYRSAATRLHAVLLKGDDRQRKQ